MDCFEHFLSLLICEIKSIHFICAVLLNCVSASQNLALFGLVDPVFFIHMSIKWIYDVMSLVHLT